MNKLISLREQFDTFLRHDSYEKTELNFELTLVRTIDKYKNYLFFFVNVKHLMNYVWKSVRFELESGRNQGEENKKSLHFHTKI